MRNAHIQKRIEKKIFVLHSTVRQQALRMTEQAKETHTPCL